MRKLNKLTNSLIEGFTLPDDRESMKLSDGKGLCLLVNKNGKYWRYNFRFDGKSKTLALGVYPEVTLSEARSKHKQAIESIKAGIDPCAEKKLQKHFGKSKNDSLELSVVLPTKYKREVSAEVFSHALSLLQIEHGLVNTHNKYLQEHNIDLVFDGKLSHLLQDACKLLGVEDVKDYIDCEEKYRELLDSSEEWSNIEFIDWVLFRIGKLTPIKPEVDGLLN